MLLLLLLLLFLLLLLLLSFNLFLHINFKNMQIICLSLLFWWWSQSYPLVRSATPQMHIIYPWLIRKWENNFSTITFLLESFWIQKKLEKYWFSSFIPFHFLLFALPPLPPLFFVSFLFFFSLGRGGGNDVILYNHWIRHNLITFIMGWVLLLHCCQISFFTHQNFGKARQREKQVARKRWQTQGKRLVFLNNY